MRTLLATTLPVILLASVSACGGNEPPAKAPESPAPGDERGAVGPSTVGHHDRGSRDAQGTTGTASAAPSGPIPAVHDCGEADKVHAHDLHSSGTTQAFVPCAQGGRHDYSGMIRIETIPEGVRIVIHATDDEVNTGALGQDAKTRDAVIVYPKGKGSAAVEVPLLRTNHGYTGDKIVYWDDLDQLTDEGTKIHIAVFDHDGKHGEAAEELSVQVAVSTGKSCERAQQENPQTIDMGGGKRGNRPDLTNDQLGAPMRNSSFFASCGLPDSSNADICVAVKNGKPLGVSVKVTPQNNRVAACIDRSTRRLSFPESSKLDIVHQKF